MIFSFLTFLFFAGTAVGSFINVLESRLYRGEDFLTKRSQCDFCHKKLRWYDMIPVLSWAWHGRRSRCCHKKLSWQYPVVELITGLAFVAIYSQINNAVLFIFYALIFTLCFTIFLQDLKYQAIHEKLLQLLITTTLIFNFKFLIPYKFFQLSNFNFLLVGFLSALPFFLLYKISHERWLGEGDVWLAAWMGLFLGFPRVFLGMYCGLIFGGVVSMSIVLLKLKKMRDTISLGPFLLVGAAISLFIR